MSQSQQQQQQLELFDPLSYYEGADVEYKSAKGGLPKSLWETYSAFANTGGGSIWLGVSQKGGRLQVEGLDDAAKVVSDFWNLVNNREKISHNLLAEDSVNVVPLPAAGRSVIHIVVPRASRRERPVYVGKDPFAGTYRRNHEGDYLCNSDEVRRMFSDQSDEPADSRIMDGFGMADVHAESLRQFRVRFAAARPSHPWLSEDDHGLLTKLGGWRRDRLTGREGLTLAGLLMFGLEHSIRDPMGLPGFQLDYRERFSDDPAIRWTDRLTLDGTWEGNLLQFYQRAILKLSAGPGIKAPFQTDPEGYRRATTAVHEAIQEALVNALIHADYNGQGGIVIDRYVDHLEFSNPGTLLVSREQLLRGGVSECRNKSLQQMFQMLGAGDKAGSGIDRIRKSWAAQHWQSPRLVETLRPDRVQLILPMMSTLPDEVVKELDDRFGEAFRMRSPDEIQALVAAQVEGEVTNQRLQEMLALHRVDITRMLKELVQDGLLVSEGQGRWTRYSIPPGCSVGADSPNSALSSPNSPLSSPNSGLDPPKSGAAAPDSEPEGPTGDRALLEIAAPVRSAGAAPKALVQRTLLQLCAGRFLSLRELSILLQRKPDTLRDRYITALVRSGALELRHPGKPNHPDQAYRATPDPSASS